MNKELTEYTFEELVDGATKDILDGLITGGSKEMRNKIWDALSTAAKWRYEKDRKPRKGNFGGYPDSFFR